MAMDSLFSPVIRNMFMEDFEISVGHENPPYGWWRYDYIFAIWQYNWDELNQFSNNIINREQTIIFTLEIEKDNQLPFHDVLISKSNKCLYQYIENQHTHTYI